ncbi:MAG: MFS transporter [Microscillaceae bacterium]|nr:MFS transporter [Microscillaceae bacterium]
MLNIQKKISNSFLIILSLPSTAMGFALSIQISALSWILSTHYKLDIHEVGLVWAAGPLAGIFGQVIIGLVSDKVWFWNGRRRPFILIGGALAATMLWALPNLDVIRHALGLESILLIAIIVALTLDIAINISFNPTRSIIADVTPEGRNRTRGYTWMQTISGFFGVLAYLIGALTDKYVLIYSGIFLVFAFSVIPPLLITEPRDLKNIENGDSNPLRSDNHQKELIKIYLAHAFTWLGVQTMFVYTFAYLQYTMSDLDDRQMGIVIDIAFAVLNTVGFILPALILEPLARRIGQVKTHTLCIAVMAGAYLAIALIGTTPTSFYILMAFAGVGWAATVSLPFAIMTERVDKSKMGFFMGIFNLSVVIPQLVVSLGFGSIIQSNENKTLIFIICAISLGISAVLWRFVSETATENKNTV